MSDNIKTPDFYATNYGVDVAQEARFPESGQVSIRINHNANQSTLIQIGLEQAEELQAKLGALIHELKDI